LQALLKTLAVCWLVRFLIVLANCVGYSFFYLFTLQPVLSSTPLSKPVAVIFHFVIHFF
jgi:hypothetical protein